jgi:hypothetical protein
LSGTGDLALGNAGEDERGTPKLIALARAAMRADDIEKRRRICHRLTIKIPELSLAIRAAGFPRWFADGIP